MWLLSQLLSWTVDVHILWVQRNSETHFWLDICVRNTLNVAVTLLCTGQIALWRLAAVP